MPLLGSYGGSSEYAYRGTIDDFPNDFSFTNQVNAIPGQLFTSNTVTITGINNRTIVAVSAGASISVNGGSYVIPTEESPVFIKNNETLTVRIPSTSGQRSDFEKSYAARVSVGRKATTWEVRTKTLDETPTAFTFTNQTGREIGVGYTSNEITISGIETGFSVPASILDNLPGQIIKNGVTPGVLSTDVVNGDRIYLLLLSSPEYSQTVSTSIEVGTYTTSWSVSTRPVDVFIDPFDFPDLNNALALSSYTAQSVTTTGIATTAAATITLTSSTVSSGSSAPNSIYQNGAIPGALNRNPELSWSVSGLPEGVSVQSYAIKLEDLSSFTRFIHWNLTGIASTITNIGFGASTLPAVATVGPTSWPSPTFLNTVGYGGPQPPGGEKRTYRLTVRANLVGAGTSSVLVKGINFFAGAGTSIGLRLAPEFPDQSTVVSKVLSDVITGADPNIQLVTAVTGCELQVEQPAIGGGFSIRRPFSTANAIVFNGDRLTARITSGNFSETKVGVVTVSNFTGKFIVTTRPRPIDTIPDQFTFTDVTALRNSTVESNEITLVGMTTFTDEGNAGITTGTNGGNARFQVTRGTQVIKGFDTLTEPFKVRNGDKIKLRIGVSSEPNITRTATFRVDGTDTSVLISGTDGFRDDIWSVTSVARNCGVTSFTLPPVENANRNEVRTVTFTPDGFDNDCRMVVSVASTDGGNPTLSVASTTLTNNIPVLAGTAVTVRMTSGDFSQRRTATVTVSNTSTAVLPNSTYSTNWVINTTPDNRETTVSLSASPTSIQIGAATTLTWTTVNAATITAFSGEGFNPTTPQGGNIRIVPTTVGTQTYSITVQGPPSAPNFNTPPSATAQVTVNVDNTPDTFTMDPASRTNQSRGSRVSFRARSSVNSAVSVTGLTTSPATTVPASISGSASAFTVNNGSEVTTANVTNGDVITVFMTNSNSFGTSVTGTLNIGSQSRSFTSTTSSCVSATSSSSYANNTVTINFITSTVTPAIANVPSPLLYTSRSGSGLFQPCRAATAGTTFFRNVAGSSTSGNPAVSVDITIPADVDAIVAVVGSGAGGTGDRGGGGGGFAIGRVQLTAGQIITLQAASRSPRGISGANSRISLNGVEIIRGGPGVAGNIGGRGGNFGISSRILDGFGRDGQTAGTPGGSQDVANTRPQGQFGAAASNGTGGGGGGVTFSAGTNTIQLNETVGQAGSGAGGNTTGTPGAAGGGGGGGNGTGPFTAPNSTGAEGAAAIFYRLPGTAAPTWDDLIQTIVDAFRNNFGRPPRDTEMNTYINQFVGSTTLTLTGLTTNIRNSGTPSATSFTDDCGNTF